MRVISPHAPGDRKAEKGSDNEPSHILMEAYLRVTPLSIQPGLPAAEPLA